MSLIRSCEDSLPCGVCMKVDVSDTSCEDSLPCGVCVKVDVSDTFM